jgi:hypothetical protein
MYIEEGRSESRQANYLYSRVLSRRDSVAFPFLVHLAETMLWSHDWGDRPDHVITHDSLLFPHWQFFYCDQKSINLLSAINFLPLHPSLHPYA